MSSAFPVRRENWEILGDGYAIAWDDLDEHIAIEGLLAGNSSGESDHSFEHWLTSRIAFSNIIQNTALLTTVRDSRIPSLPCLPSLFCPRWIPKTL